MPSDAMPLFKHLKETPSTMEVARDWALSGPFSWAPFLTPRVLLGVLADQQTKGRGRREKHWVSPEGGFYTTYVLGVPERKGKALAELNFVACLAIDEMLREICSGVEILFKWPNDLLYEGGKLGGVLIEVLGGGLVSIGIGLNLTRVSLNGSAQKAAFLQETGAFSVTATEIYDKLLVSLQKNACAWFDDGFDLVREQWMEKAHPLGTPIKVMTGSSERYGTYEGLNEQGLLLMRMEEGLCVISAGDVSMRVIKNFNE